MQNNKGLYKFAVDNQKATIIKIAAAAPEVDDFLKRLKKKEEAVYVIVCAVGAGEFYGPNSRGDWFPEAELIRHHKTFESGHVFLQHFNKDPANAMGKILFSAYNSKMHRVELILEIWKNKAPENLITKIEAGESVDVSMGCKVKRDVCVAPYTRITCAFGRKKYAKDITLNDKVLTHRSRYKKIEKIYEIEPIEKIISFKNSWNNEILKLTANHPTWCIRREKIRDKTGHLRREGTKDFTPEYIEAKDLKNQDYILYPIDDTEKECEINNKYLARLFGYYLAEGSPLAQSRGHNHQGAKYNCGIQLSFHIDETDIRYDVEECCKELKVKCNVQLIPEKNAMEISISSRWLVELMIEYGGRYSHSKFINYQILQAPKEIQMEIVGTYLNGDGSQYPDKGSIRSSSVSKKLTEGISTMLLRNRIIHTINKESITGEFAVSSYNYRIYIPKSQTPKIAEYTFCESCDAEESSQFIFNDNYYLIPIKNKRTYYFKIPKVYNFQVKDDETYVADGCIVHNCSICGNVATKESEHCEHVRDHAGAYLPDGRQVYAINYEPRFFDISVVRKGADKTSKILQKVASFNKEVLQSITDEWEKRINKEAKIPKKFDIYKETPSTFLTQKFKERADKLGPEYIKHLKLIVEKLKPKIERLTPKLADSEIRKLAQYPLDQTLSTLRCCYVNLSPPEFQKLVLTKIGKADLAKKFEDQKITFDYTDDDDDEIENDAHIKLANIEIAKEIKDILIKRSSFPPFIIERIESYNSNEPMNDFYLYKTAAGPVLDKIKLAYKYFRRLPPEQRSPLAFYVLLSVLLGYGAKKSGILAPGLEGYSYTGEYMTPQKYQAYLRKQGELLEKNASFVKPLMMLGAPLGWYGHAEWRKMKMMKGEYPRAAPIRFATRHPLATTLGTYGMMQFLGSKVPGMRFMKIATVKDFSQKKPSVLKNLLKESLMWSAVAPGISLINLPFTLADFGMIEGGIKGVEKLTQKLQKKSVVY